MYAKERSWNRLKYINICMESPGWILDVKLCFNVGTLNWQVCSIPIFCLFGSKCTEMFQTLVAGVSPENLASSRVILQATEDATLPNSRNFADCILWHNWVIKQ